MDVAYSKSHIISRDGTHVGYRQLGKGPGLVLLHGELQASQSLMLLAGLLAADFTLFIPDRRGRGLSEAPGPDHTMQSEVDDLAALLKRTRARNVLGVSAGALITLSAALSVPGIDRIALYEPPLALAGARTSPLDWVPRYERAMSRGHLATALVACLKGTGDRDMFSRIPGPLLIPMVWAGLRKGLDAGGPDDVPVKTMLRAVQSDTRLVAEMAGQLERFRDVTTRTLLLGGTRSMGYLGAALDALEAVLPNARRVTLAGLGHIAADNNGQPDQVAPELRRFFAGA